MASKIARLWADRLEKDPPDPTYNNFNQVPAKLQDEVRSILTDDGYDILEDGSIVKRVVEDLEDSTDEAVE